MTEDPREFGLTAADLRAAADRLYEPGDDRLDRIDWTHGTQVRYGQIRSRLRSLADAIDRPTCEREEWCDAPPTRTYARTDFPHYGPGDERADVPFETVRTCDQHPMGDGQDGRPDYGWRLELPAEAVPGE
jgi:hypothetical protein